MSTGKLMMRGSYTLGSGHILELGGIPIMILDAPAYCEYTDEQRRKLRADIVLALNSHDRLVEAEHSQKHQPRIWHHDSECICICGGPWPCSTNAKETNHE